MLGPIWAPWAHMGPQGPKFIQNSVGNSYKSILDPGDDLFFDSSCFFADLPEYTHGGLIYYDFLRPPFLEIWISKAHLSTNHYYQEKVYQWNFNFPEYGDLWRIEGTFHEGNRLVSNPKVDTPRGVILIRAYEYVCQKYNVCFLYI